jgi:hypothetical protein
LHGVEDTEAEWDWPFSRSGRRRQSGVGPTGRMAMDRVIPSLPRGASGAVVRPVVRKPPGGSRGMTRGDDHPTRLAPSPPAR